MSGYSDTLTGEKPIKQTQCQNYLVPEIFFEAANGNKYGVLRAERNIACAAVGELGSWKKCFGYLFYSDKCRMITYLLFSAVATCLIDDEPSRPLTMAFIPVWRIGRQSGRVRRQAKPALFPERVNKWGEWK
jgi:hypothetical protein